MAKTKNGISIKKTMLYVLVVPLALFNVFAEAKIVLYSHFLLHQDQNQSPNVSLTYK